MRDPHFYLTHRELLIAAAAPIFARSTGTDMVLELGEEVLADDALDSAETLVAKLLARGEISPPMRTGSQFGTPDPPSTPPPSPLTTPGDGE